MKFTITISLVLLNCFAHAQKEDSSNIRFAVTGDWTEMGKVPGGTIYIYWEMKIEDEETHARIRYELKTLAYNNKVYKDATREEEWIVNCAEKKYAISKSTLRQKNGQVINVVKNENMEWKKFSNDKTSNKIVNWICD